MTPVINPTAASKSRAIPRILVVDDEPNLRELVSDVVSRAGNCRLIAAADLAEAERIIAGGEKIDLLLADVQLPDGNGMSLLPRLREKHPTAAAVIITGTPSINGAVTALRAGVVDFLPKPFTADHLLERINNALERQTVVARKEVRLARLKGAVKKLNITRHTISKKVDLLCNDLVSAYGELSRQFDAVRMQESFRKLLNEASDLEQLLCHAMDWILRHTGYCNVAIWLASEEKEFELGAYMKYTIAGEQELTDAMKMGLLTLINREGNIHLFGPELRDHLTAAEFKLLAGQEILGCNCTYLGESLAAVVMFRDEKSPFTDEDTAMIRAISPIFAVALANIVRKSQAPDDDGGALLDDTEDTEPRNNRDNGKTNRDNRKKNGPKQQPKNDADWWKRGEPPPF